MFINELINQFYLECEDALADKKNTVDKLSKNIEKLGEIAELQEAYGSDIDKEENAGNLVDSEGRPLRVPKKRTKMCTHVMKKTLYKDEGIQMVDPDKKYYMATSFKSRKTLDPKTKVESVIVCPLGKKCSGAHNPIQLDLAPMSTKIKNLQGVVKTQTQKLKSDKPIEAWKPSAASFDVSSKLFNPNLLELPEQTQKKKKATNEEENDEKRRKGILERENIFRRPFDKD